MKTYRVAIVRVLLSLLVFLVAVFLLEVYLPKSYKIKDLSVYELKSGTGYRELARDLKEKGIIKSAFFFETYVLATRQYSKLQAGRYQLSPSMTIAQIVRKIASGDVMHNTITVIEGWNIGDIAGLIEEKEIYSKAEFAKAAKTDFSSEFEFLKDKPKSLSLEGYIFPDTYFVAENARPEDFIKIALSNFDQKMTGEMKQEIARQKKSVFQIVTMASMVEKEVVSLEDKKIVAGILWKRIQEGIPLQVDATVNYVTGKSDARAKISDTKIDSPYNTYKYYGLPKGPISNPGIDSIVAAIYPQKTSYYYYLSDPRTGKTVFSKTLDEHNLAIAKYFK